VAVGLTFGAACSACTAGRCVDAPTAEEPLCLSMHGAAPIEITECPNKYCGENARQTVRLAAFAKRGLLPVAGGLLDQTQSFITALELVWSEQAEYRREKKLIDPDA
jgi:hypothetical protein